MSKKLEQVDWKNKLVLFGKTRPSPLAEVFSDASTPVRFVVQNQVLEHNLIAVLSWIKKLEVICNATKVQVSELESKSVEYETKVIRQGEELRTANQQEQDQNQKISDLESKISGESIAEVVSQSEWA